MTSAPCPACRGFGTVIVTPCKDCDGEGREHVRKDIEVEVPAGVAEGTRIRLSGRGEASTSARTPTAFSTPSPTSPGPTTPSGTQSFQS